MRKKFFASFDPPRVVKASDRWYISFYAVDESGQRKHYRPTFNLNRIIDLRIRQQRANELCEKLTWWMAAGKVPEKFDERKVKLTETAQEGMKIMEALELGLNIKCRSDRQDSQKTYRSHIGILMQYLQKNGLEAMPITIFGRVEAVAFLDYRLSQGISNTTYNNARTILRAIWGELQERDIVKENPWSQTKAKECEEKNRRNFTADEARAVFGYIKRHDVLLLYAIILEYCCYIRPAELRRLRMSDIVLDQGIVIVRKAVAKTRRERIATIPALFLPLFDRGFFDQFPASWYLFGEGWKPSSKQTGKDRMYRRHKQVLDRLHAGGQLKNIDGLSLYSWKDTGITDALEQMPLLTVQDQAGHASPGMTLRYRHKSRINDKMRKDFPGKLLE